MPRKYPTIKNGSLVQPVMRGYRMACCDCGLVHRLNFRVVITKGRNQHKAISADGGKITVQFRAWRDEGETKKLRRKRK